MKLLDIIDKSEVFSFIINSEELALRVTSELRSIGFELQDPEMENIFTECFVKGRNRRFRFDIYPQKKQLGVMPLFGSTSTINNSIDNPVFSEELVIFIVWILRMEGSIP